MVSINKTNFLTETDNDNYQAKTSVQSYLCHDYAEQRTEQVAPMECWPSD